MAIRLVYRSDVPNLRDIESRFWAKVDKTTSPRGCWLWTGKPNPAGYGQFKIAPLWNTSAHRFSFLLAHGHIPMGLWVLHDCPGGDNRACVNPNHLWLGTHEDNMADMKRKGRAASGARNSMNLYPEMRRYGDENPQRKYRNRIRRGEDSWSYLNKDRLSRGEGRYNAKLTEDDVRAIRARYAAGGISLQRIADEYGMSKSPIWQIVTRKRWTHI